MPRPFLVGLGVAAADLLCTAGFKTIKLGREAQRYTGFASGGRADTPPVGGVDGTGIPGVFYGGHGARVGRPSRIYCGVLYQD